MKNKLRTIPVNGQISFIFKHECYSCHHIIVIGNITIFLVSKFRIEMISTFFERNSSSGIITKFML